MDIFGVQPYRISPLAKREFSEKQKLDQTSDNSIDSTKDSTNKLEKKNSPQETENQQNIQRELQQLKSRDREVRAHEAAHIAAGGSLIRGAANYKYQRGPDGLNYAVGGDVSIDISKGNDPHQNLQKALTIQRAALAPASPSATDHAVAAQASQMAAVARVEIARVVQVQNDEQVAASESPQNNAGVSQYQRLERETSSEAHLLSEYA